MIRYWMGKILFFTNLERWLDSYQRINRSILTISSRRKWTAVNSQRGTLRPIMQLGKRLGRICSLLQDKLMVNGKSYTVSNLDKIPFDISHLGTERTDTHILFGGRLSRFSNFFTRKKMLTLKGRLCWIFLVMFICFLYCTLKYVK